MMPEPADDIEPYLATAAELLRAEGMTAAAEILRTSAVRVEQTGFDNYNGGTSIWTVYLEIAPAAFAQLGDARGPLQEQIGKRLQSVVEQHSSNWYGVTIAPKVQPMPEWRVGK